MERCRRVLDHPADDKAKRVPAEMPADALFGLAMFTKGTPCVTVQHQARAASIDMR